MTSPVQFPEGEISCEAYPPEVQVVASYVLGKNICHEIFTPMGIVLGLSSVDDPKTILLTLIFMGFKFVLTVTSTEFDPTFLVQQSNIFVQDALSMYKDMARRRLESGNWIPPVEPELKF